MRLIKLITCLLILCAFAPLNAQTTQTVVFCSDGSLEMKRPSGNCKTSAEIRSLHASRIVANKRMDVWIRKIQAANAAQRLILLNRLSAGLKQVVGMADVARVLAEKAMSLATQNQAKLGQVETKLNRVGMADCDHVRENFATYKKCLELADKKNQRVYGSHQQMMGLYGMQLKQNSNLSMNFSCNDGKDCETNVGPTPASPMELLARSYQTPPQPVAPAGKYSKTQWLAPVGLGLVVGGGFWLGHHLMADTGRTQVDFSGERVHWSESAMIGLSAFALTSLAGYTYMFITD